VAATQQQQQQQQQQQMLRIGGPTLSAQLPHKALAAADRGLKLPAPFKVNHPKVLHVSARSTDNRWLPAASGHGGSSCGISINWNAAEGHQLELCSSATGSVQRLLVAAAGNGLTAGAGAGAQAGAGDGATAAGGTGTETQAVAAAEPATGTAASADAQTDIPARGDGIITSSSGSGSGSSIDRSRLSKAALFDWYLELRSSAQQCAEVLACAGGGAITGSGQAALQDVEMQDNALQSAPAGAEGTGTAGAEAAGAAGVGATGAAVIGSDAPGAEAEAETRADTQALLAAGVEAAGTEGAGAAAGAEGAAAERQESYAAAKRRNVDYSTAKAALHQHMQQRTKQAWLKCSDVLPDLDKFHSSNAAR
jgi:hypothetical protein